MFTYRLVVAFASATQGIPISQWTVALLVGLLGFCAYRHLKSQSGSRTLGSWLVVATLATSMMFPAANWIRDARADDPIPVLALVQTSPVSIPFPDAIMSCLFISSQCIFVVAVTNKSGAPATITALTYAPYDTALVFVDTTLLTPPRSRCVVGRVLSPNETCYLAITSQVVFS